MSADIPVLAVSADTLPEAWEVAVLAVLKNGFTAKTEYDKAQDKPSADATVMVEVRNPFKEPRIHKNFPGGPVDLEIYRQEVVNGIHDHWINPKEGKWTYTYHQRLAAYQPRDLAELMQGKELPMNLPRWYPPVNQITYMAEKLVEAPHTRRAQAITWIPTCDPQTDDPPCLNRVWVRMFKDEDGWALNMNTHWRSRDLWKAWFMNAFALTDLQRVIATYVEDELEEPVRCGRYVDISDSLHIYGKDMNEKFDAEIEKMKTHSYRERAWDSFILEDIFNEVREKLAVDPDYYAKGGK